MYGDRQTDYSIFDKQTTKLTKDYSVGFFNGACRAQYYFPFPAPCLNIHIEQCNVWKGSSIYDQSDLNFTKLQTSKETMHEDTNLLSLLDFWTNKKC